MNNNENERAFRIGGGVKGHNHLHAHGLITHLVFFNSPFWNLCYQRLRSFGAHATLLNMTSSIIQRLMVRYISS
jgi:hypothetical protein